MKRYFSFFVFFIQAVCMQADQKQLVVVNGDIVNKNVKSVTFQGTQANITYNDGTQQIVDRSAFAIYIKGITATSVEKTAVSGEVQESRYALDGKPVGNGNHKGVVIQGKRKHVIR